MPSRHRVIAKRYYTTPPNGTPFQIWKWGPAGKAVSPRLSALSTRGHLVDADQDRCGHGPSGAREVRRSETTMGHIIITPEFRNQGRTTSGATMTKADFCCKSRGQNGPDLSRFLRQMVNNAARYQGSIEQHDDHHAHRDHGASFAAQRFIFSRLDLTRIVH